MFFSIFFTIFLTLIFYVVYRYIIRPKREINRYLKAGFSIGYFYPFLGEYQWYEELKRKYNNFEHIRLNFMSEHPNSKGVVTNTMDSPSLYVCDTALKKDFFTKKMQYYSKFQPTREALTMYPHTSNLIISELDVWKKHRRILSTCFSYNFVMSTKSLIKETAISHFEKMKNLTDLEIMNEFQTITGSVIMKVIMGSEFSDLTYKNKAAPIALAEFINEMLLSQMSLGFLIFGKSLWRKLSPKFGKLMNEFEEFLDTYIYKIYDQKFEEFKIKHKETDLQKFEGTSLIENIFKHILLHKEQYSHKEAVSDIVILFVAGTDTTGHLLAHLLLLLQRNPEKFTILLNEINNLLEKDPDPTAEKIMELEYLHGTIKESLRKLSPAGEFFPRIALQDHYLGDVFISKGTIVYMGFSFNFNDPKIFKDTDKFVPERWIKGHELYDGAEEKDFYSYLPFSGGARICLGWQMSLIEAKVILIEFLKRYKYKITNKEPMVWTLRLLAEFQDQLKADLTLNNKK